MCTSYVRPCQSIWVATPSPASARRCDAIGSRSSSGMLKYSNRVRPRSPLRAVSRVRNPPPIADVTRSSLSVLQTRTGAC